MAGQNGGGENTAVWGRPKTCPSSVVLKKLRRGELGETEKNALQQQHYAIARDTVVTHCSDKWLEDNKWLKESNNCKKERG